MKKILTILCLGFSINSAQTKPTLFEGINSISRFIASDYYANFSKNINDLQQIDSIYCYALKYYHNDYSETLLALTFATLPYDRLSLNVPLLGNIYSLELPAAEKKVYKQKNKNLPAHFFEFSPSNEFGDKDKLSHFFGSAFLSYSLYYFNITEFIGIFIELFEDAFKIEGNMDNRDLYANFIGNIFGKKLQEDQRVLPSDIIKFFRAQKYN